MHRTYEHAKETKSRDIVRKKIDSFFENGDALVRDWSERDYGIDFVLELFDDGVPTGKIAFLQVKGSERIEKLKKSDEVSCSQISMSCFEYAKQNRIPLILIYCSVLEEKMYYIDLQSIVNQKIFKLKEKQKGLTVRIPYTNSTLVGLFELINRYYLEERR